MASSEEEKLIQMVIDFIESEPNTPKNPSPFEPKTFFRNKQTSPSLQDVLQIVTDDESVILEKLLIYSKENKITDGKNENLKKWIVWGLKKDGFEASLCRTSWVASYGRPSGNHEYIDVMMKNNNGRDVQQTRIIIDMDFRSQFDVVRPTQVYSELLNSLPNIFVGTEEKLKKIVSLICSAAKRSLREKGLHIPPWRKESYMKLKWLSFDCNKIPFSSMGLMDFPKFGVKF